MEKSELFASEDKDFLRELQKEHWRLYQQNSSTSTPPSNGKEFQMHLYNKLWDNVTHKENRLWTFLTVYGAALGVAIGFGNVEGVRFEASFLLILLTYWAAEIIIDTDWWSIRNRLMVRGIERRAHVDIKGIIPTFYHSPKFQGESLHNISLLVFLGIGIVVFAEGIGLFDEQDFFGKWAILKISVLYLVFVLAIVKCAHTRERRISEFYRTLRDLNDAENEVVKELEEMAAKPLEEDVIAEQEAKDRSECMWRRQTLAVFVIVSGMTLYQVCRVVDFTILFIASLILLAIVAIYFRQMNTYMSGLCNGKKLNPWGFSPKTSDDCRSFARINLFLLVLFLSLIGLIGSVDFKRIPDRHISAATEVVSEMQEDIREFGSKLENLRGRYRVGLLDKFKSRENYYKHIEALDNLDKEVGVLSQALEKLQGNSMSSTTSKSQPSAKN